MRLLLDTHALLWWWTDDARLSGAARTAIADTDNEIFVSAASAWEVAIKHRLGRLTDMPQAAPRFVELMTADGFVRLPVDQRHALHAGACRNKHRDLFDRMLAAQAELENLTIVTCDEALAAFGGSRLW